jgi:S-adenosylmethionine hydrolase
MTDYGTRDGYPAILKGVIWTLAPQVEVWDLTHEISPQDVWSGALTLGRAAPFFPAGTIFLAVVDPGVGTSRRPLAARLGDQIFVAPDNGLLTWVLESAERAGQAIEIVHLDRPAFFRSSISHTFHGRDVFAPVAAHLALGAGLAELGTPISDPVRLRLPQPVQTAHGWQGEVIHIDSFGNLATNLTAGHIPAGAKIKLEIAGIQIDGMVQTFSDRTSGALTALLDSSGALSVVMVNGSAAQLLDVGVGEPVSLTL